MKRIFSLFAVMVIAVAAMAADYATVKFAVSPNMTCQNCENKIKNNIRYEKGVKQIDTSIADQLVTIKYDAAKTNPEKIAKAFGKIGYKAVVATAGQKTVCAEKQHCASASKDCCGSAKGCDGKKECGASKKCDGKKECGASKKCDGKKECGASKKCDGKKECSALKKCDGKKKCDASKKCDGKKKCPSKNKRWI